MRWLAAAMSGFVAAAAAQTLDLRLRPDNQGVVAAVRSVDSAITALPPRAPTPGSPSDVSPGPPVGAVVALPIGKDSDKTWRFGAAGTPEMQPYLDKTAQEVVVAMDSGERRVFRPPDAARFRVGQRVSVEAGALVPESIRKDGN
jgi:hypothetical protein